MKSLEKDIKKNKNIKILKEIFFEVKKKSFKNNIKLYEALDSLEILEFISIIEKKFKIKFKQEQINENNFETLQTINQIIMKGKK